MYEIAQPPLPPDRSPRRRLTAAIAVLAVLFVGFAGSAAYLVFHGRTTDKVDLAFTGNGGPSPSASPLAPVTPASTKPTAAPRNTLAPVTPAASTAPSTATSTRTSGSTGGRTGTTTGTKPSTTGGSTGGGLHCSHGYYIWNDGKYHCEPQPAPKPSPTASPKPKPQPTATSSKCSSGPCPALVKPHGAYNGDLKCTRLADGTQRYSYSFTFSGTFYWAGMTDPQGNFTVKNQPFGYDGYAGTKTVSYHEDFEPNAMVAGQQFGVFIKVGYTAPGDQGHYASVMIEANDTWPSC